MADSPLSEVERGFLAEAADHVARFFKERHRGPDGPVEGVYAVFPDSTFERTAAFLIKAGIADGGVGEGIRFVSDTPVEPGDPAKARALLNEAIGLFVDVFVGWSGELADDETAFMPPPKFASIMRRLCGIGLLDEVPEGWRWSVAARPVFIAECIRFEDNRTLSSVRRETELELADAIWASLSAWRRRWLALGFARRGELYLFIHLFRRWDGARLHWIEAVPPPLERTPSGATNATRIIHERLRDIGGAAKYRSERGGTRPS